MGSHGEVHGAAIEEYAVTYEQLWEITLKIIGNSWESIGESHEMVLGDQQEAIDTPVENL